MRQLHLRFALDAIDTLDYVARINGASDTTVVTTNGVRWALLLADASHDLADRHAPLVAEAFAADAAPYVRVAQGRGTLAEAEEARGATGKAAAYAALFADLAAEGVA